VVLAVQINGKLVPDALPLRGHRRLEKIMLDVLRKTTPASDDRCISLPGGCACTPAYMTGVRTRLDHCHHLY
jgi:hypothetical protein